MPSYHYRGPSIDHSLLSPSGRMSKRARKAAMDREAARLFAGVDWQQTVPQPTERETLTRRRDMLLDLAARGMSPRKFRKEAAEIAAQLERIG